MSNVIALHSTPSQKRKAEKERQKRVVFQEAEWALAKLWNVIEEADLDLGSDLDLGTFGE